MHPAFHLPTRLCHLLLVLALLWTGSAAAAPPAEEVVQGLYEGTWKDGSGETKAEVRVIAMGSQAFKLMARRVSDSPEEKDTKVARAEIDGKIDKDSDAVTFAGKADGADWKAMWTEGAIAGKIGEVGSLDVKRVERKSPTLGKQPPPGSVVLLDGKKFENLERGGGKPWRLGDMSQQGWPVYEMALQFEGAKEPPSFPTPEKPLPEGWKLLPEKRKVDMVIGIDTDGSIEVPKGGMQSKQNFAGSYDAHIEFKCNFIPKSRSQGRGNSGVDLPNGQEIQVLDSFGMGTYLGGCCGGLYNHKDPDGMEPILSLAGKSENKFTRASLPPLEWQTYDIEFRAKPQNAKAGKSRLTVYHNGIKIHDAVETGGGAGKFRFQDHGNPVRYRNVWVQPIAKAKPDTKQPEPKKPEPKQPDSKPEKKPDSK